MIAYASDTSLGQVRAATVRAEKRSGREKQRATGTLETASKQPLKEKVHLKLKKW